ncbi:hypothetical protein AA14337_3063 [Acetobacter malorum DSM 14337]|uniref:LexA repressor DNA-binding domain-containing protein n=1 Tax=Acetobacter malorum DSM 14337 TaxID=1307910 RepID=A0ABQ0PZF5_9PROT|nr:hypothetical protein [Acetobacter malorum]GBQ85405.1 hypothetical protein AA14337_3063 [Acetobacter malorum DSM 14337]
MTDQIKKAPLASLTDTQRLVYHWAKRLNYPGTPELIRESRYLSEPALTMSRVRSTLNSLSKKGLVKVVPQSDDVERWQICP